MNKHILLPEHSPSGHSERLAIPNAPLVRQAVIMAGGKGTRLHPYSALFPKPLMPLGDMPILELLLRRMKSDGVEEVIIAVNHLRHLIEAYFGDGASIGLKLRYSNESKPLGTAGALGNMLDLLDETFFLANGDLLTTMDLGRMAFNHVTEKADASIGVFERENKIDFGLIEFDNQHRLSAYREKPTSKYFVSMGVYILDRAAIRPHVSNVDYLDMPTLLLKIHAANGTVVCFEDDCVWLDIGRPDDFALAQQMFERDRDAFLGHA
ncbi:sugar phosphate nucleotidyltransferase [Bradyrhizobium sp. HKCCYLS20291]|uniref:sugar phosphate nucleotidyltransferase n=1 Tax=Bradyrhizobium sp. HKCCYLS20291 TaxID=3420766 RepID=UPI003EBB1367